LHPEGTSYAWSGRSSKVIIRSMGAMDDAVNGTDVDMGEGKETAVGSGPLSAEGAVVEAGKGKFGMALEYVSLCSYTRRVATVLAWRPFRSLHLIQIRVG
jgi:hypothetical protein